MNPAEENRASRSGLDGGAHLLLWNDRLSAFVDDALTEDDSREVLAHLEVCEVCRSRVQAYLGLRRVVSAVPRRFAPRIRYLRRQERPRIAWRQAPALWAFSGALGILLIFFVTRSLFVGNQRMLQMALEEPPPPQATGAQADDGLIRLPDEGTTGHSLEGAVPEEGAALKGPQEGVLTGENSLTEKERRHDTIIAQSLPKKTAADRENAEGRQEKTPPSARDEAKPADDLARPQMVAAPPEAPGTQEPVPVRKLLRVTLVLPPDDATAENKTKAVESGGGVRPSERSSPSSIAPTMTPKTAQTVSFVLPQKEWEALEDFLKKHYIIVSEETAPGELRVKLTEAEPSPDLSQKEEKKNEDGKSRKKKMPLP